MNRAVLIGRWWPSFRELAHFLDWRATPDFPIDRLGTLDESPDDTVLCNAHEVESVQAGCGVGIDIQTKAQET